MGRYKDIKNHRRQVKERIIYVMGDKCQCCGYDKCSQALEIHHLNSEEKDFTIGQNLNRSWELICQELPKGILVCANCHREIHAGLINDKNLKSSYDEIKAQEISNIIKDLKTHKLHYCIDCGKIIDKKATRCKYCADKAQRIVSNRPTREQLKTMIRTFPFTSIAKKYNVSDNAIRRWCKAENLPSKVSDIKKYTEEEWEKI